MSRFDFTPYRRSTVGFDRLFDLLENQARLNAGDNYPPFNISRRGEDNYRITLAVAGFRDEDLSITLEDRQLAIRGRQQDDADGRIYLHRGIAARQFQRTFVLADGVEIISASMENGLLFVDLQKSQPVTVVQTIKITKG